MYLSLPLPSTVMRTMTVTMIYGDGSVLPMPYTVTVPKHGCCKDLSQALGIQCCLRGDESLLLAEVNMCFAYSDYGSTLLYRQLDQIWKGNLHARLALKIVGTEFTAGFHLYHRFSGGRLGI